MPSGINRKRGRPKRTSPSHGRPQSPHRAAPVGVARPTYPYSAAVPWTAGQTFTFVGTITNGVEVGSFAFVVLAGDTSPQITGGWVKLNTIDRPQRKGFTVPAGYDPITLDVPVQFDAVVASWRVGSSVEYDIQQLEWMAGRGNLFHAKSNHGVGHAASGDPPLVTVASYDANGRQTGLIESNLQGIDWIVSNITWDNTREGSFRDRNGNRTRQKATISLTEFVAPPGTSLDSPSTRSKVSSKKTTAFRTDGTINTIAKVLEHYASASDATSTKARKATLDANRKAGLKVRDWNQKLPVNTRVLIPNNVLIGH